MKMNHYLRTGIFVIFFFFIGYQGFSQKIEQERDSILNLIESIEVDSLKAKQYLVLCKKFLYYNPEQSIQFAKSALSHSRKGAYTEGMMDASRTIFNSHHVLGSPSDSLLNYLKLYEKYALSTEDERDMMGVYFSYGLYYSMVGKTNQELEVYLKTLKLVQKYIPKSNKEAILLNNIAIIYSSKGQEEEALNYYHKALEFAEGNISRAGLLANSATIYLEVEEKLDSAKIYLEEARGLYESENDLSGVAFTMMYEAKIKDKLKQHERAYQLYSETLNLINENNLGYQLPDLYQMMTYHFYDQKKYEEAIPYGEKMIDISVNDQQNVQNIKDIYKKLHDSYQKVGNYKRAYEVQSELVILNDSTNNIQLQEKLKALQTEFEVEQKEAENRILKLNLESRKRQSIILTLALVFALALGISLLHSSRQRKKYNQILEQEVEERTQELKQANYELRTFNYIASHDIKEPIRVIGGLAGLIRRELSEEMQAKLSEYFDTIKNSTRQLYTLIEDFASYTTMSKEDTIQKQDIDLNKLTSNVVDNLQETIKKYQGEIVVSELPLIRSSSSLLFTVLKNLIENGLKYNKSEKPTVNITYDKNQTHHKIIVTDNGIGIKPEYHQKIFEMFKRLHTRNEYEGSGIGLAIVKLSINKLGGKLELKSEEEKGSKFIILLPLN